MLLAQNTQPELSKKYFGTKRPDGFYEDDTNIFIIENK